MTYLFISDLHLSPKHPRLVRGFLDLLDQYKTQDTVLYILGDWFNAWVGDDYTAPWLDEIVEHLKAFTAAGNRVYFQVGNRDFALHQVFLNQFNGQLLPEIDVIHIGQTKIRIEHGDALCTDDVKYQRFKKIIRNPFLIGFLRKTPLNFRTKLADGFRKRSNHTKEFKSYEVMDVNQDAVAKAMHDVDVLIHGHTHRPQIHHNHDKIRIVLGDWREDQAQILVINSQKTPLEFQLSAWQY